MSAKKEVFQGGTYTPLGPFTISDPKEAKRLAPYDNPANLGKGFGYTLERGRYNHGFGKGTEEGLQYRCKTCGTILTKEKAQELYKKGLAVNKKRAERKKKRVEKIKSLRKEALKKGRKQGLARGKDLGFFAALPVNSEDFYELNPTEQTQVVKSSLRGLKSHRRMLTQKYAPKFSSKKGYIFPEADGKTTKQALDLLVRGNLPLGDPDVEEYRNTLIEREKDYKKYKKNRQKAVDKQQALLAEGRRRRNARTAKTSNSTTSNSAKTSNSTKPKP